MRESITQAGIVLTMPHPAEPAAQGSSEQGFNIEAAGTGSITGVSYSIPGHSEGAVKIKLKMMALSTENIENLNKSIMNLLDASQQKTVEEKSKTAAHANLSLWYVLGFGGDAGASASYEKTYSSMESLGLSEDQISKIIEKFFDIAKEMSRVEIKLKINNNANDYEVSGDVELFTMSGTVKTSKGTRQYRALANAGTAGSEGETAPAKANVIHVD